MHLTCIQYFHALFFPQERFGAAQRQNRQNERRNRRQDSADQGYGTMPAHRAPPIPRQPSENKSEAGYYPGNSDDDYLTAAGAQGMEPLPRNDSIPHGQPEYLRLSNIDPVPDIIQDYRARERNPIPSEIRNHRSHDQPHFHPAKYNTAGSDNIRLPQSTKQKGKFNKNDSVPNRQRQLHRVHNPDGSRKRPSRKRGANQGLAGILGPAARGTESIHSTTSSIYAYLKDYDDQGKNQSCNQ